MTAALARYLPGLELDALRLCVWLGLLALIFVPLEKLCAQRPHKVLRAGFFTDVVYYFLNNLLPKLLLIAPLSFLAKALRTVEPAWRDSWASGMPLGMRLAAALLVADFGSYWGHRAMHRFPTLWRFHAVHHSAEEMDWLVNTHAHPLDLFFTRLCGLVPMYALGLAQPSGSALDPAPALVAIVGAVWGFLIHANVRWRFGWLEWLVSTPAFHHWHHTKDGPEYANKNYAALLPLMDLCFGTFYIPGRQWPASYGADTPMASGLAGQLLQPFAPVRSALPQSRDTAISGA